MRLAQCHKTGHHSAVAPLNTRYAIVLCFVSCGGCVPVGGKRLSNMEILVRFTTSNINLVALPGSSSFQGHNPMRQQTPFRIALSDTNGSLTLQLELFALVNLGLVQSLASGILGPTDAIHRFYHADNCLYVQKHFRNKEANAVMSHGVQLPDLFESLPAEEAQREFYHELEKIRFLCLKLLEKKRSTDPAQRATA
jgi:hypothetical protein